ncbi:hypothetical protein LTR85_005110 [Meristemomyces frigidus]|nr:hypothetical protein LTR85_005110 [Meristemomyces frigidus]
MLTHVTTASSSQKKRRLGPFEGDADGQVPDAKFDQAGLEAHAKSSPSSSPQPPSLDTSDSPSPASSHTTHITTPPHPFPAHISEEVQQGREQASGSAQSEGGASPSGQFAGIHIDSGSSMSGSENGGNGNTNEPRALSSPNRALGARSASPAKRSAADMEDAGSAVNNAGQQTQQTVPGSFTKTQEEGSTDFDEAMAGITNGSNGMDTQDTIADGVDSSAEGTMTANTSATSLQSEAPPPYSEEDKWKKGTSAPPSIDEQVKQVYQIIGAAALDEGTRGYLVSWKWLAHVMSRSTDGMKKTDFPKEAREGPIGMVDNSDLVPPGAFDSALPDLAGNKFVPLKAGLTMGDDFEVVPSEAWILITSWYRRPKEQDHTIVRYAHNTADPPAQNIVYELYPPVVTIRKVPQPSQQNERPPSPQGTSMEGLRRRKEMRARGQSSPDEAVRLVSSRSERFQKFLMRAKEAAGIPATTKVKLWRELVPENVAVDEPAGTEAIMPSPPESRSVSPVKAARTTAKKLVVSPADFKGMDIGQAIEHIDARDETNNEKYNGASTVQTHGIFEDQTIILEEQIGGPAGGEFQSDGKKGPKLALSKKGGSKPGSAPASGRTSPTPGGMLTRGRARRDGRTRGTVGLSNLGNTCYMNSALQCIRSVKELALYFLSGTYKSETNTSNPLGHKGLMAKQYAGVLEGIYADTASGAFTPTAFKKTLGNIQPLFSGYQQQDSQEFLSFLVDALHEDLNRIIKKPYNENPDSDDKTVHDPQAIIELGETYRANHKARNDSVAMDLFSGFYKNTMECPKCDKISITFDPFSSLTVQLPIESTFQHTITFVPLNGAPINHAVDIDKNASIKTLKDNIASKHPGVTGDRLWMVEVYNHKIYKVFENQQSISEANIQANDYIFAYELPGVPTNIPEPSQKKSFSNYNFSSSIDKESVDMASPKADSFAVPVFSRQKNRFNNGWEIIMHPLYIMLTREEAQDFDIILKKVLIAVSRMTSRPILTEFDADKTSSAGDSAADAATSGEAEKEESSGEEAARLSDRSVPSEDGYVDVSIDKPEQSGASEEMKDADGEAERKGNPIPARFMDPEYFVVPELRNQLFALNYTKSAEGTLCTGMQSISEREVRNMFDRVKKPVRRASVQSSSSGDSSTSTGSGQANGESETSDADDDEDKPDIALGMGAEDTLHLQTPTSAEPTTDDELPDDPLDGHKSNGRRRGNGKKDKYGRNKKTKNRQVTYSKHDRKGRRGQQQRPGSSGSLRSTQSQRSLGGKTAPQDENPYYIKLGEGIVLDWYPEGLDGMFGGDPKVDDDMRGHWLSSADGRHLDFMPDPALDAKKEKRAARKKNGITLEDCFVETGKREILSEDNSWFCSRCKELRQAAKTLEIWTIPDILIVHLKRFGGNRSFRDKIDVFVDYPIEGLDMTEKIGFKEDGKEYLYDLFAVDNHYGGLGGGHYTALAKNFYDEQWYDYNDSSCSKVGEAKVHSPAAYLLFYRRRSQTPLGPQYLQELASQVNNQTQGEDADESESGEGKLGGPTSSLRGSSSALVAAGAGTNGSVRNPGDGGPTGAGNSLTTRETTMTDQSDAGNGLLGTLNGKRVIGPQRPPHLQFGSQGSPSWGFDVLAQPAEADERDTDRLIEDLDDGGDGDADSTVAEADAERDSALGDDHDYQNEPYAADEDYNTLNSSGYGGANTPIDTEMGNFEDDHALYSGAHEQHGPEMGALHLEDAGMIGADPDSPPAHEIHVADEMEDVTGVTHELKD